MEAEKVDPRRLTPSRALKISVPTAGALSPVLVMILSALGVPVTPEIAASIGTLVTAAIAYFTRGGRKDEPQ